MGFARDGTVMVMCVVVGSSPLLWFRVMGYARAGTVIKAKLGLAQR